MERRVKLYTGAGGKDLFDEAFEDRFGIKRIYMGRKQSRIFKNLFKVAKSASGRLFRRIQIEVQPKMDIGGGYIASPQIDLKTLNLDKIKEAIKDFQSNKEYSIKTGSNGR